MNFHAKILLESSQGPGIFPIPTFHEFPDFLGIPTGINNVHIQLSVTHFMIQINGFVGIISVSQTHLRLQIQNLQVLQHGVALFYHVNEQTVFILIIFVIFTYKRFLARNFLKILKIFTCQFGGQFVTMRQIGENVSDLRVDRGERFSLEQGRHSAGVIVANPRDQNGIQSVQMSTEIPKAGFAAEASIDQQVESINAEQSRVALSAGEDVECGMGKSDVAHHVGRWQLLLNGLRD